MRYRGPQPADFQNVEALNAAFLGVVAGGGRRAEGLLAGLSAPLRSRLASLTMLQRERLAKTPFLLFSFCEADSQFWAELFQEGPNGSLFNPPRAIPLNESQVLGAGLGFIWQLARDNTYAARLVCGASLHWCEQLAERPLLQVVSVAMRADTLRLRREHDAMLWHKLLHAGVASERPVRRAARICALQRLLTESHEPLQEATALAARRMRHTSLKVAESNEP